jgi:hypothetical protein
MNPTEDEKGLWLIYSCIAINGFLQKKDTNGIRLSSNTIKSKAVFLADEMVKAFKKRYKESK